MYVEKNFGNAVISTDITGINSTEMYQMHQMKERVAQVLKSHSQKDNSKKEYLSDEELTQIWAILSVFTEDYSKGNRSEFDKYVENHKPVEEEKPVDKP